MVRLSLTLILLVFSKIFYYLVFSFAVCILKPEYNGRFNYFLFYTITKPVLKQFCIVMVLRVDCNIYISNCSRCRKYSSISLTNFFCLVRSQAAYLLNLFSLSVNLFKLSTILTASSSVIFELPASILSTIFNSRFLMTFNI